MKRILALLVFWRRPYHGLLLLILLTGAAVWLLRPPSVAVSRVVQGELRQSVVASGRVRTPQRIEMAALLTARVSDVLVREGDTIAAGDLLLTLDDAEHRAAWQQAQASLAQQQARLQQVSGQGRQIAEQALRQAEANQQQSQQNFARTAALVDKGFYSPAQLDEAKRLLTVAESQRRTAQLQLAGSGEDGVDLRLARSNLAQAEAALAAAAVRLRHTRLQAPVAGRVLTRQVEPGDTVQPGRLLLTLAPLFDTELTAQIDEKNLGLLSIGQAAWVSADAFPQQRFAAQLSYIAPSVDALRGSVEVRLKVPEPPPYLKHEMTVSIDIAAPARPPALLLPLDTIHEANGPAPWVFVIRDGKAQRQDVTLGMRGSGRTEILAGLHAGEAAAVNNAPLAAGQAVRAVDR